MLVGLLALVLTQPFSASEPGRISQPTLVYLEPFPVSTPESFAEASMVDECKEALRSLQQIKTPSPEEQAELQRWQHIHLILQELEDLHRRLQLHAEGGDQLLPYQNRQASLRQQLSQLYAAAP